MFGEKEIVGQTIVNVRKNSLITLPKFTLAEPKESLVLSAAVFTNMVYLFNEEDFAQFAYNKRDLLSDAVSKKKITLRKYLFLMRIFCAKNSGYVDVKKDRSITLSEVALKHLEFSPSLFVIGVENHLELYRDFESYEVMKKTLK